MSVTGDSDWPPPVQVFPGAPDMSSYCLFITYLPFHYLKAGNAEVEIGTLNSAVHLENPSGDVAGCGEARKTTAAATSQGSPIRRSGVACSICRRSASSVSTMSSAEVAAAPTAIALIRILGARPATARRAVVRRGGLGVPYAR
jgi:hypothetical protein